MPEAQIYTESQAQVLCALAISEGRAADLLNVLSDGGAATIEPDGWGGGHLVTASGQAMRGLSAALGVEQPVPLIATARNIVNQLFDEAEVLPDKRQAINDQCDTFVLDLLTRTVAAHA